MGCCYGVPEAPDVILPGAKGSLDSPTSRTLAPSMTRKQSDSQTHAHTLVLSLSPTIDPQGPCQFTCKKLGMFSDDYVVLAQETDPNSKWLFLNRKGGLFSGSLQ